MYSLKLATQMNSKPQPNPSMSATALAKLIQSTDPGTASLARSSLEKKVNNLWDGMEAKEIANAKRRKSKIALTIVEALGFIFAGASAFCWFWSAMIPQPTLAADWKSKAALLAVGATLMLIVLRGKSNMNAKAEREVHDAIKSAVLYQKQNQLDLESQLIDLEKRLINLEANKDPSINRQV